jgi:hypothetical protein
MAMDEVAVADHLMHQKADEVDALLRVAATARLLHIGEQGGASTEQMAILWRELGRALKALDSVRHDADLRSVTGSPQ